MPETNVQTTARLVLSGDNICAIKVQAVSILDGFMCGGGYHLSIDAERSDTGWVATVYARAGTRGDDRGPLEVHHEG